MRINDSLLRKSVRAVITEAFGFTPGIEESDMAFFEKAWDKLMIIQERSRDFPLSSSRRGLRKPLSLVPGLRLYPLEALFLD
jgi:hypothetical protein